MECSCLYAYSGQNCKHMAALLYAVADQKENDVQTESELGTAVEWIRKIKSFSASGG